MSNLKTFFYVLNAHGLIKSLKIDYKFHKDEVDIVGVSDCDGDRFTLTPSQSSEIVDKIFLYNYEKQKNHEKRRKL